MSRWLRLNVDWDSSPWVFVLSEGSQLAWIKLLCHVKLTGSSGTCKALGHLVAARKWGVGEESVAKMLQAGVADGAIVVEDGEWILPNWSTYQEVDTTAKDRMRKMRGAKKQASTPENEDGSCYGVTGVTQGVTRRATETETETETNTPSSSDEEDPPQAGETKKPKKAKSFLVSDPYPFKDGPLDNPDSREVWQEFSDHRKAKRAGSYTPQGLARLRGKLEGEGYTPQAFRALLAKAITSQWRGLPEEVIENMAPGQAPVKRTGAPTLTVIDEAQRIRGEAQKVMEAANG